MRRGGTPMDTASLFCVIPKPSMKSSIRISPGWMGSIRSGSVVVDEFDIIRTSLSPDEAETPLRVHTDAVLTASITRQLLKTVARRNPEILDFLRRMDQLKLPKSCALHDSVDAFDVLLVPDTLGVLVAERSDHENSV